MQTKRLKAWLYPVAAEREYVKLLDSYAKEIQAATYDALKQLRQDDFRQDDLKGMLSAVMGITQKLKRATDKLIGKLSGLFAKISAFNRNQFAQVIKSAYGSDLIQKREPWLEDAKAEWSMINAELIKDIGVDFQRKVAVLVSAAITNGTSMEVLKAQILEIIDMPVKRAELIAVDQTQKLNGQLMRERQERLGVKQYKWRGRLDARERPEHVAREGKIYSWDSPPYDGHPGVPIRCRCWAEMIPPPLEDLDLDFIRGNK